MSKQLSFKAHQREVEPMYRYQIDGAQSAEDVRTTFERTALAFLNKAAGEQIEPLPGDIVFDPDHKTGFSLSQRMQEDEEFQEMSRNSDLLPILELLSGRAMRRYKRISTKQTGKSGPKIQISARVQA